MEPSIPVRAKIFICLTAACGMAVLGFAFLNWHSNDVLKFICYLLIALLSSTMKVRLPGMESTMSVHFLFVLLGVLELSLAETLAIGCAAALLQSLWKTKQRPQPLKITFNVLSMTAPAIFLTYYAYHLMAEVLHNSAPLLLLVAALTYFVANTVPLAVVLGIAEGKSYRRIWSETYFWSLPYYLVGAAIVGLISYVNHFIGWENALLIVPVMYWIYRSYLIYLGRLEEEKKRVEIEARQVEAEKRHVEEVCALHLRTIEGLALAIDAKDHTTHKHLHRVRTYAVEIAKDLNLSDSETDALRAAALLHDIGKLAVPDHIINKPGRLTPAEFEKMKIHPVVGAEILERVAFPYPVAPVVRSHHEKWNGKGYPDGLKGEEIPIGARILAAVDCLDALASDRQYRKALPLDDAMKSVAADAGISFDPRVVEILQRRYQELEALAVRSLDETRMDSLCLNEPIQRGERPAAGFEHDPGSRSTQNDFLSSIASARQEAHTLFELSQDLGNSLSLDENLSLMAMRLRKLVPYDSIVAYVRKGDFLVPEFVSGENFRIFFGTEDSTGDGAGGLGGAKCALHLERQPGGGDRLCARLQQRHRAALGACRSAGGGHGTGGCAGAVPVRARCVYRRSFARVAGDYLKGRVVCGECSEIPGSGEFGDHRLPDRHGQRPRSLDVSGAGTGAVQARECQGGGDGMRSERVQGGERPVRASGRRQGAEAVCQPGARGLPPNGLRGAYGRR
jgi:putative nucleotidyltransferase with HDIG domain